MNCPYKGSVEILKVMLELIMIPSFRVCLKHLFVSRLQFTNAIADWGEPAESPRASSPIESLACRKYTHTQSESAGDFPPLSFSRNSVRGKISAQKYFHCGQTVFLWQRAESHMIFLSAGFAVVQQEKKPRTENKNRVCMRHNLSASVWMLLNL